MLFSILALALFGTSPAPQLDRLLVQTAGGVFGVQEPGGWTGYTDELAEHYQVSVVFLKTAETPAKHDVSIRVRLTRKQDEQISEDLSADAQGYEASYPGLKRQPLPLAHPKYTVVSEAFLLPGRFSEYVAYVSPGPALPYMFSVALSVPNREATAAELASLNTVLSSLAAIR